MFRWSLQRERLEQLSMQVRGIIARDVHVQHYTLLGEPCLLCRLCAMSVSRPMTLSKITSYPMKRFACNLAWMCDSYTLVARLLPPAKSLSTQLAKCARSFVFVDVTTSYLLSQLPVLVHELLAVEIWREKVFPLMLEKAAKPQSSFPAYLVVRTCTCTCMLSIVSSLYLKLAALHFNLAILKREDLATLPI